MEMESCKLFIGGISWETSEDCLREYFESYGEVLEAVIMKDRTTGRARGFGFVVFADSIVAERVLLHKHIIDGKSVEAKKAVPRDDHLIINKSNSSLQGSPGPANTKKIFVGGLPPSVTEPEFKKYFAQFGTIIDVVVMYDHRTQRPRGFGFITYDSEEAVDRVLQRTFHELDGKMVEVKVAVPKEMSPNNPNRNLNSFGSSRISTLLNDYAQGFNMSSPISGYGVKPEGSRYSPVMVNRGSFSPFGHGFGIELNFDGNQNQSYVNGSNGGYGRPFSPGYNNNNASLSRYGGLVTRNQPWGNNGGYIGNSGITGGSGIGTVGEGRNSNSYRGYNNNAEFGIGYGTRSNGIGIESRGGGGVGHMSSLGWGMSGEGVMRGFSGYMNNTEELLLA